MAKAALREQQVADALAALRDELNANTETGNYYQFAYQDAVSKLDATIAKLGLLDPIAETKISRPFLAGIHS